MAQMDALTEANLSEVSAFNEERNYGIISQDGLEEREKVRRVKPCLQEAS